jgi:hypothetical protein
VVCYIGLCRCLVFEMSVFVTLSCENYQTCVQGYDHRLGHFGSQRTRGFNVDGGERGPSLELKPEKRIGNLIQ